MSNKQTLLQDYNTHKLRMLGISILVDAVGMASYLAPGLGEFADIGWAPIAAAINFMLFKGRVGVIGGAFTFVEELLPGVDLIPSTTINWMYKFVVNNDKSMKEFVEKRIREHQVLDEAARKIG
jgi:hypothetical protein